VFFPPRCDREGQRRTEGGDRVVATLSHPEATGNLWEGFFFVYLPTKKDDPGIQGKHFYPGKTIGDNIGRRMGDGLFFCCQSSTQEYRGWFTDYKDTLLKVGWVYPKKGVDRACFFVHPAGVPRRLSRRPPRWQAGSQVASDGFSFWLIHLLCVRE